MCRLKKTVSQDFKFSFFTLHVFPGFLINPLPPFGMFPKIRKDIRDTRLIIGFSDIGEQLQYLRPVSPTPQSILFSKSMFAQDEPTVGVNLLKASRIFEIFSK
jgi:hypothetical protein